MWNWTSSGQVFMWLFPMRTNIKATVSTRVKTAHICAPCITHLLSQHSTRCHFHQLQLTITKTNTLNMKMLQNVSKTTNVSKSTADVQATAQRIDTRSHFWWFIIPSWMKIKQNLSQSPALIWWMISWENSTTFCFLKPSTRTPNLHTKTHFQLFHFLCTGPEVRRIGSHVALQVPTMEQKKSDFRIHAW